MKSKKLRAKTDVVRTVFDYPGTEEVVQGQGILCFTGCKAYYLGGGWWTVSGYSSDGRDIDDVVSAIENGGH